jgi:hypothetical protein
MTARTRHGATQPEKERAKKGRARLSLRIRSDIVARLDRIRGSLSRSAFIAQIIMADVFTFLPNARGAPRYEHRVTAQPRKPKPR